MAQRVWTNDEVTVLMCLAVQRKSLETMAMLLGHSPISTYECLLLTAAREVSPVTPIENICKKYNLRMGSLKRTVDARELRKSQERVLQLEARIAKLEAQK